MIDIHAHLLMDDLENRTSDESKNLLKKMIQKDFDTIIAISEYHPSISELDIINNREKGLDILLRNIYEETDIVTLMTGSEVSLDQNILPLLERNVIQLLGSSNYLLVKYPKKMQVYSAVNKIVNLKTNGITPIITNVDRTFRFLSPIKALIQAGALIQIDYLSVLGLNEKANQHLALKLLKKGMVDLLASNISCEYDKILSEKFSLEDQIKRYISGDIYNRVMFENPMNVIENNSIENLAFQKKKRL